MSKGRQPNPGLPVTRFHLRPQLRRPPSRETCTSISFCRSPAKLCPSGTTAPRASPLRGNEVNIPRHLQDPSIKRGIIKRPAAYMGTRVVRNRCGTKSCSQRPERASFSSAPFRFSPLPLRFFVQHPYAINPTASFCFRPTLCQNAEAVEGPSLDLPARYQKVHPTGFRAAIWRAGMSRTEKIVLQF